MATLTEQVQVQLADLDSQIDRIKASSQAQIKTLQIKKAALLQAGKAITPDLEDAVLLLKDLGLLHIE